ncbi:hypothetical protein [Pararhizobium sp. PWRC1-1]|uniref:hypothetical protein n=1 Tax=Pararhizobium sp. PWRC1-1 TaxID=2804566 RepID=UPI003CF200E2
MTSLSQTLIKLTAPGRPDIYQGREGPDFSLVDPDNCRRIDFAALNANEENVNQTDQVTGFHRRKAHLIRKVLHI